MSNVGSSYAVMAYTVGATPLLITSSINCNTFSIRPVGGNVVLQTDLSNAGDTIGNGVQELTEITTRNITPRFPVGASMFYLTYNGGGTITVIVKFLI